MIRGQSSGLLTNVRDDRSVNTDLTLLDAKTAAKNSNRKPGIFLKGRRSLILGLNHRSCSCAVQTVFKEFIVMDEQLDRKQLQRKLILCRRLSETACDPATSSRLAKLIVELEHSLRQPN
jgi:hypothetical protein